MQLHFCNLIVNGIIHSQNMGEPNCRIVLQDTLPIKREACRLADPSFTETLDILLT
jgi:hypothetical protein